jgi:molybdopterin synthase sulfur carrier subunit
VSVTTIRKIIETVSVKINIHPFLTQHTNGQDSVEVNGSTVGQCLEQLVVRYPELRKWLFEKDGKLNRLVEIYVNAESSYPEELAKPVKDGDELYIIIIISGG